MTTIEIAYSMIDNLDEEQLNALVVILRGMMKDTPPKEKKSAASLCGIFHDAANPDLIPLEKTAWEQAAVEKHIRFLEEQDRENS